MTFVKKIYFFGGNWTLKKLVIFRVRGNIVKYDRPKNVHLSLSAWRQKVDTSFCWKYYFFFSRERDERGWHGGTFVMGVLKANLCWKTTCFHTSLCNRIKLTIVLRMTLSYSYLKEKLFFLILKRKRDERGWHGGAFVIAFSKQNLCWKNDTFSC